MTANIVYCSEAENGEKGKLRVVQSDIARRLQTYATSRGWHLLRKYLNQNDYEVAIHPKCQKQVTKELRKYHKNPQEDNAKVPRLSITPWSSVPDFDWRNNCLFCSKPCTGDKRYQKLSDYSECERIEFRESWLFLFYKISFLVSYLVPFFGNNFINYSWNEGTEKLVGVFDTPQFSLNNPIPHRIFILEFCAIKVTLKWCILHRN